MEKKSILSERGVVYYWIKRKEDLSTDKCVFFCHGLTADHTLFDKQIDFWSKEYILILWDMPLHGASKLYYNFSLENAASEMKTILDKEHIGQCTLMGQSAGGYVCQVFMHRYPEMVSAFVGIDTLPVDIRYYKKRDLFIIRYFSFMVKYLSYNRYCKKNACAVTYTGEAKENFQNSLLQLGKKGILNATSSFCNSFLSYLKQNETLEIPCPSVLCNRRIRQFRIY